MPSSASALSLAVYPVAADSRTVLLPLSSSPGPAAPPNPGIIVLPSFYSALSLASVNLGIIQLPFSSSAHSRAPPNLEIFYHLLHLCALARGPAPPETQLFFWSPGSWASRVAPTL